MPAPLDSSAAVEALVLARLDELVPAGSESSIPPELLAAEIDLAVAGLVAEVPRELLLPVAARVRHEGPPLPVDGLPEDEAALQVSAGPLATREATATAVAGRYPAYVRVPLPEGFARLVSLRLGSWTASVVEPHRDGDTALVAALEAAGEGLAAHPAAALVAEPGAPSGLALDAYGIGADEWDGETEAFAETLYVDLLYVGTVRAERLPLPLRDAVVWRACARIAGSHLREASVAAVCESAAAAALAAAAAHLSTLRRTAPGPALTHRRPTYL